MERKECRIRNSLRQFINMFPIRTVLRRSRFCVRPPSTYHLLAYSSTSSNWTRSSRRKRKLVSYFYIYLLSKFCPELSLCINHCVAWISHEQLRLIRFHKLTHDEAAWVVCCKLMFLISIKLVYLLYYVVVVDAAELASDACCKVLEACSDEVLSQLETGQNQNKVWKIVK